MLLDNYNGYTEEQLKRMLAQHKLALESWSDKTEWVQQDEHAVNYLGMHRADAINDIIKKLKEENQTQKEKIKAYQEVIIDLATYIESSVNSKGG